MNLPTSLPPLFDLGFLLALGLFKTRSGARRATLEGRLGPYRRVGRRFVFEREAFLEAWRKTEIHPAPALTPGDLLPRRADLDPAFGLRRVEE